MSEGWIKLHRKMVKWEWYDDANTMRLFLHLLLTANHEDKNWRGKLIKRGERITSLRKLADELDLGVQSIRTSLGKLISTQELTKHEHTKYTHVKINNYDDYQQTNKVANKKVTSKQHTTNTRLTTNKNDKNDKNNRYKIPIGRKGKRPGRNPLVEKCIQEFTKLAGHQPTDPKPRFVAHNLVQKIQSLQKRRGKTITQRSTLRAIEAYFGWVAEQDWSENIQLMNTVKLKLPIFEAELDQRKAAHEARQRIKSQ